ncbi:MAG: hypothetical protein GX589_05675 [Deltaproteobacteria bacterium]|nr:hypothetical protein [Deltaproteobacteria bacterium]
MLKQIFLRLALLSFILPASWADAEEILITDINDRVRAQEDISGTATVEFILSDSSGAPAHGFQVYFTNLETKLLLIQDVSSGSAVFTGIEPGRWQVSSSVDWARFDSVLIRSDRSPMALTPNTTGAEGIIIPTVIAGVALAGPIVTISDSHGDATPLSPSS